LFAQSCISNFQNKEENTSCFITWNKISAAFDTQAFDRKHEQLKHFDKWVGSLPQACNRFRHLYQHFRMSIRVGQYSSSTSVSCVALEQTQNDKLKLSTNQTSKVHNAENRPHANRE